MPGSATSIGPCPKTAAAVTMAILVFLLLLLQTASAGSSSAKSSGYSDGQRVLDNWSPPLPLPEPFTSADDGWDNTATNQHAGS